MKKGPGPDWSDEEKAEGEKMSKAWEAYFSEAKSENQNSSAPLTDGEEAKIAQIQAQHEAELLKYPNVVGVAPGIQTKAGKPTGEPCIVVYVSKKLPKSKLAKGAILPDELDGIPVDVVEIGKVEAL